MGKPETEYLYNPYHGIITLYEIDQLHESGHMRKGSVISEMTRHATPKEVKDHFRKQKQLANKLFKGLNK